MASRTDLDDELAVMDRIQRRVLWLATRMIDHANHERPNVDGIKVGGHQASSASVVSLMTALWMHHLNPQDLVSVKPHASPVLHSLHYLLGELDSHYLTELRSFHGLQAYPSRTKDPDRVDFSTGSVGLGAVAPLFAAATRRYVDAHFGARDATRFVSILGDAELDEGNIWEAIADRGMKELGNVMWIVDFNRQSLDRVVPGIRIEEWRGIFEAVGWHVVELKYGTRLRRAFSQPGGEDLRKWIDGMPNEQYQSLFGLDEAALRRYVLETAPSVVQQALSAAVVGELGPLLFDLGGHDLAALVEAYEECDKEVDRPSVIFAYTIKGWGLPIAGNPRNHSILLNDSQLDDLRKTTGLDLESEWSRFDAGSPEGRLLERRAAQLRRAVENLALHAPVKVSTREIVTQKPISTQEAFGRILVELSRNDEIAPYLVTTAPDVATSTNLAGFINRTGVFSPSERTLWSDDALLHWKESPTGQHMELGISEMNLFLLLGQLGLSCELSQQTLIPIGTVYDPFICRGLDALIYSVYSGSRFILTGTPSGVTLAPEGGAHQSTITPSIGLELPGVCLIEPAFAEELSWLLCDAVEKVYDHGRVADGELVQYFRLSTRPIDQSPFQSARRRYSDSLLRASVLSGAYRLVDGRSLGSEVPEVGGESAPEVTIAASGAVIVEVLAAAAELREEGIVTHVVNVTSLGRLYAAWNSSIRRGVHTASLPDNPGVLRACFPAGVPIVTVHDGASHAMAWLGSALGVPCVSLGVDEFGESGTIDDLYAKNDLSSGAIVNAALMAISSGRASW